MSPRRQWIGIRYWIRSLVDYCALQRWRAEIDRVGPLVSPAIQTPPVVRLKTADIGKAPRGTEAEASVFILRAQPSMLERAWGGPSRPATPPVPLRSGAAALMAGRRLICSRLSASSMDFAALAKELAKLRAERHHPRRLLFWNSAKRKNASLKTVFSPGG